MILTGDGGTGKSSLVNHLLKSRMSVCHLPITHLLTPVQLQADLLERLSQLEKKLGQRWTGGGGGKKSQHKTIFFLDDIHLTSKHSSGAAPDLEGVCDPSTDPPPSAPPTDLACPLLELVCYMQRHRRLRDFTRVCEHLLSPRVVASSTPEEYWRLPVRLTRGMCRLPFLLPSDRCLHQIFCRSVRPWLEAFPLEDAGQVADVSVSILNRDYMWQSQVENEE